MRHSLERLKLLGLDVCLQAFHIPISHAVRGSLMSKAGKWLDRGLSKLIGVAELPEGVQAADATRPPLGPPQQYRRASSQPGSPKVVPPSLQPLPVVA